MDALITIGATVVYRAELAFTWTSGMAVDADGCPRCYAPHGSGLQGLDALGNAGKPGDWFAVITDNGKPDGQPIVQGDDDPAPGFYVSPTALGDHSKASSDPRRYVDANAVPYVSVPPELRRLGVGLGDVALVEYRDQWSAALVADVGPR